MPNAFSAASNARSIAARSSTSASTTTACPPAASIFFLQRFEPVGAARHQHDLRAVRRQHLGEARAEPARRAGDQRDAAGEIEQFGGLHGSLLSPAIQHRGSAVASPGTNHSTTSTNSWISTNGMMPT